MDIDILRDKCCAYPCVNGRTFSHTPPTPKKKYLQKNLQKLIHFNGDNLFR